MQRFTFWLVCAACCGRAEHGAPPAHRIDIAAAAKRFAPAALECWAGDQLSWRNHTRQAHHPGVVNRNGEFVPFLPEPLKPGAVSSVFSPMPRLNAKNEQVPYVLTYACALHPGETGTIRVLPTP